MWFLTEICLQTKCGQLKKRTNNEQIFSSSCQNFLKILVKCCQLCVEPPIESLTEVSICAQTIYFDKRNQFFFNNLDRMFILCDNIDRPRFGTRTAETPRGPLVENSGRIY